MRDRPSSPRAALHAALAATVSVAGNDAAGFERRVDAVLDHLAGDGWELTWISTPEIQVSAPKLWSDAETRLRECRAFGEQFMDRFVQPLLDAKREAGS